jgi:hypothetical protein
MMRVESRDQGVVIKEDRKCDFDFYNSPFSTNYSLFSILYSPFPHPNLIGFDRKPLINLPLQH